MRGFLILVYKVGSHLCAESVAGVSKMGEVAPTETHPCHEE